MIDIDFNEANDFLQLLDQTATTFTFQTFDDGVSKDHKDQTLARIHHGSLIDVLFDLGTLNSQGAGVYVNVNETDGRGRTRNNIVRTRAVWQDDDKGYQGSYPLEPSIVVQSSAVRRGVTETLIKFQRYWLVEGLSFEEHGGAIECMVADYGSDPRARGIERVLRLPGFFHCKGEPCLVKIVGGNGQRYTRDEVIAAFPPLAPAEWSRRPNSGKSAPLCELDLPASIEAAKHYLTHSAPLAIEGKSGDHATYKVCATTAVDYALSEHTALELLVKHWNPSCVPSWSVEGLQTKVRNALCYSDGQVGSKTPAIMFKGVVAHPQLASPVGATDGPQRTPQATLLGSGQAEDEDGIVTIRASSIVPHAQEWLIQDKIPLGAATVWGGNSSIGKSTGLMAFIAAVTNRAPVPVTGEVLEPSETLLFSQEEDNNTIRLRAAAAGVDLDRLHIFQSTRVASEGGKPRKLFNMTRDAARLETTIINNPRIKLVIFDPATSYVDEKAEKGGNTGVRAAIEPVIDLAERYGFALILVTHFNKANPGGNSSAIMRFIGSIAWVARCRAAWAVAKDPADETGERRLILCAKNNLAKDTGGWAYRIETFTGQDGIKTSRAVFEIEAATESADDAVNATGEIGSRSQRRDEVGAWIMETLKSRGKISRPELLFLAAQADFSEATFDRARRKLSIVTTRKPGTAIVEYSLPLTKEEAARAVFGNAVFLPNSAAAL